MVLFSASDFTGFTSTLAVSSGVSDVLFAGSVDLNLSTGITQQVFDILSTALKCIHYMETNTPNPPNKSSRFWDLGATTLKSSA